MANNPTLSPSLVFKMLERDYDPQIHGDLEFAVHFGRVYLFSVPHALLEEGGSVTVAMLRTNKRKVDRSEITAVPGRVTYADEEARVGRRRRRKSRQTVENEEKKKKRKRGNPSRSSLFTEVRSPQKAKKFLLCFGFNPEEKIEKHVVTIYSSDDDVEFYVQFDKKLKFIEFSFPKLRWCMVDVKRQWQLPQDPDDDERDDIILDGGESDVRFLLQSRYILQPQDTPQAKYERYQRVLQVSNQCDSSDLPFSIQEDLWKDVKLIRSVKSTKFTQKQENRGLLTDLTVSLDEVHEYSRPTQSVNKFGKVKSRWEVSLKAVLPKELTDKDMVQKFLEDVWKFSFQLSSFVSK